jgi:hypothetical protein
LSKSNSQANKIFAKPVKMPKRGAEAVKRHVEESVRAKRAGIAPESESAKWGMAKVDADGGY